MSQQTYTPTHKQQVLIDAAEAISINGKTVKEIPARAMALLAAASRMLKNESGFYHTDDNVSADEILKTVMSELDDLSVYLMGEDALRYGFTVTESN